jgi:hypothetical protein
MKNIPHHLVSMLYLIGSSQGNISIVAGKTPRNERFKIVKSYMPKHMRFVQETGPFRTNFHFSKRHFLTVLEALHQNQYPVKIEEMVGIPMAFMFDAYAIPTSFEQDLNLEVLFDTLFGSKGEMKFRIIRTRYGDFSLTFNGCFFQEIEFPRYKIMEILQGLNSNKTQREISSLAIKLGEDSSSDDYASDESESDDSASESETE